MVFIGSFVLWLFPTCIELATSFSQHRVYPQMAINIRVNIVKNYDEYPQYRENPQLINCVLITKYRENHDGFRWFSLQFFRRFARREHVQAHPGPQTALAFLPCAGRAFDPTNVKDVVLGGFRKWLGIPKSSSHSTIFSLAPFSMVLGIPYFRKPPYSFIYPRTTAGNLIPILGLRG